MAKDKILDQVLSGLHDKYIRFTSLIKFLKSHNFKERIKGDHHIFTREDITEIINFQPQKD